MCLQLWQPEALLSEPAVTGLCWPLSFLRSNYMTDFTVKSALALARSFNIFTMHPGSGVTESVSLELTPDPGG